MDNMTRDELQKELQESKNMIQEQAMASLLVLVEALESRYNKKDYKMTTKEKNMFEKIYHIINYIDKH
jgi:hypothetical protein